MITIVYTILVLVGVALLAALLLYVVSQKFKVEEDPRIDLVEAAMPGANCGGCGQPGCRGFASAFVAAEDISTLYCPVGGSAVMDRIAAIVGKEPVAQAPRVAVVRCAGSPEHRPRVNQYQGARSCSVEAALYGGETNCSYGCLGLGDCAAVCEFDALHMDPVTQLPVVDQERCTACGKCVKACPKMIIELRLKGPKGRRVFVSCRNMDKGGVAKKSCKVACIGCSLCQKQCAFEAIEIKNNLSFIDSQKCKLCRKCVSVCPTGAIWEVNFPPRKPVENVEVKAKETTEATGAVKEDKSVVTNGQETVRG